MKYWLFLLLLFSWPRLHGQAPVAGSTRSFHLAGDSASVLVLPVSLRYEDIYTDTPLDPAQHKGAETAITFDSLAFAFLSQSGIHPLPADPADSLQQKLIASGRHLLRPVIPTTWRSVLAHTAQSASVRYILVCSFRVKVGPGGYWDPNTGAIGASSSYGRMHAALLDPFAPDGKPCWTQDVELRKLPRPDSKRFSEAVQLLFQLLN
ncbi:MAG: hypothetical protein EP344_11080 [Bacteroidetes bacterium]|nr:MAG: hypothetical protein EP344_11080 [Bacteroidota bacterium]